MFETVAVDDGMDVPHDYVEAIVLPFMKKTPTTESELLEDFSTTEAQDLILNRLPVRIAHSNKSHMTIGTVLGTRHSPFHHMVLLDLMPRMSGEALSASKDVAVGDFKDVSLKHQWVYTPSSDNNGGSKVVMPIEVSLTAEGGRYHSKILNYFPSAYSLERMTAAERAAAAKKFGYEKVLPDQKEDEAEYIYAFAREAKERINERTSRFDTVSVVDWTQNLEPFLEAAEESRNTTAMSKSEQEQSEGEKVSHDTDTASDKKTESSSFTLSEENFKSDPLYAQKLAAEIAKQKNELAARNKAIEDELAQYKKKEEDAKVAEQKKREEEETKARERFESARKSFEQNAKDVLSDAEIAEHERDFDEFIQKDPMLAARHIERVMTGIAVRSQERNEMVKKEQQLEAARKAHYDEQALRQMWSHITEPTPTYTASRASPPPPSSASQSMAPPARSAPPAEQRMPPPSQLSGKRPLDKDAAQAGQLAEDTANGPGWAAKEFERLRKHLGRVPTHDELAYGGKLVYTGSVARSATGEMVRQTKLVRANDTPRKVTMFDLAPESGAKLRTYVHDIQRKGMTPLAPMQD